MVVDLACSINSLPALNNYMKKMLLLPLGFTFIIFSLPDNSIPHYLLLFSGIAMITIAFKEIRK